MQLGYVEAAPAGSSAHLLPLAVPVFVGFSQCQPSRIYSGLSLPSPLPAFSPRARPLTHPSTPGGYSPGAFRSSPAEAHSTSPGMDAWVPVARAYSEDLSLLAAKTFAGVRTPTATGTTRGLRVHQRAEEDVFLLLPGAAEGLPAGGGRSKRLRQAAMVLMKEMEMASWQSSPKASPQAGDAGHGHSEANVAAELPSHAWSPREGAEEGMPWQEGQERVRVVVSPRNNLEIAAESIVAQMQQELLSEPAGGSKGGARASNLDSSSRRRCLKTAAAILLKELERPGERPSGLAGGGGRSEVERRKRHKAGGLVLPCQPPLESLTTWKSAENVPGEFKKQRKDKETGSGITQNDHTPKRVWPNCDPASLNKAKRRKTWEDEGRSGDCQEADRCAGKLLGRAELVPSRERPQTWDLNNAATEVVKGEDRNCDATVHSGSGDGTAPPLAPTQWPVLFGMRLVPQQYVSKSLRCDSQS